MNNYCTRLNNFVPQQSHNQFPQTLEGNSIPLNSSARRGNGKSPATEGLLRGPRQADAHCAGKQKKTNPNPKKPHRTAPQTLPPQREPQCRACAPSRRAPGPGGACTGAGACGRLGHNFAGGAEPAGAELSGFAAPGPRAPPAPLVTSGRAPLACPREVPKIPPPSVPSAEPVPGEAPGRGASRGAEVRRGCRRGCSTARQPRRALPEEEPRSPAKGGRGLRRAASHIARPPPRLGRAGGGCCPGPSGAAASLVGFLVPVLNKI